MTLLVSIVEKENILKSWPRDRLIQELAQPSGNFPPYLVASRIKDVEAMQKAAEAEAAEKRGSQQAGSVYERMITGQPEPSPQGSFAQNRPMSPGVPNVPSQIAAQPVPQPPQQPTQIPMAVAARGGYAGNLPTVRAAEGYSYPGASIGSLTTNRDVPRLTYEVWKRLAKARREGGDSRLYGAGRANYEKGAAPVVDPAFGGILSQMARVERNRAHGGFDTLPYSMTAAHGGPVGGLPVSPSRGGFVKRYANDGGYVNNLPTVRMQGEGTFGVSDDLPPLSWQTVSDQMAQDSLDNPELSGVSLQFQNLLSNNQPLFANNKTALANVISDYKKAKEEALAGKRVETDLTAIRDQGMTDPRFQAVVDRIDYNDPRFSDFSDYNANPAITAPLNPASNVSVTDRLKALYGRHSLQREYNPDDGTWSVANDPSRRGGLPLDLEALVSGRRVWDGRLQKFVIVGETPPPAADAGAPPPAADAGAPRTGGRTMDIRPVSSEYARRKAALSIGYLEDAITAADVPAHDAAQVAANVAGNGDAAGADVLRKQLLAGISGSGAQAAAVPYETPASIEARKLALLERRKGERGIYEAAAEERIGDTKAAEKASIAKIKTAMDEIAAFEKGGALPPKLQYQYITGLLAEVSGALLGTTTWYAAGAAFIKAGIKLKAKSRGDYAESLVHFLTNESELQGVILAGSRARNEAKAALAKSMYEFARGDEAAGQELENTAIAANSAAAQLGLQLEQVQATRLSALASVYTAINAGFKTSTVERAIKQYFDQMWKQTADDLALREKWFFKGPDGIYRRENFRAEQYIGQIGLLLDKSKPPGVLHSAIRQEDKGWSEALSKGRTALGRFRDGAFEGDLGGKAKALFPYLNKNFGSKYKFGLGSGRSDLEKVSEADFMEAWLNIHHNAQVKESGEWGAEYQVFIAGGGSGSGSDILKKYDKDD